MVLRYTTTAMSAATVRAWQLSIAVKSISTLPAHLLDTDSIISTAIVTAVSTAAHTSQAIRSTTRTDSMLTSNDAARCVNGRCLAAIL
jgi:hypothetical protein